jgi:hypothetical protein
MTIEEPKPTQVQIKGINLRNILDDRFLGAMDKVMGKDLYFIALRLVDLKDDNKGEIISLFHPNKEKSDQNILNIDTSNPETLDKVLKVVLKYYGAYEDEHSE